MSEIYSALAPHYDRLMQDTDYSAWCDFYEACFAKYGVDTPAAIVDLGCGTGSISIELAKRGNSVTGLDTSEEMLALAYRKAEEAKVKLLLLSQNMTCFDSGTHTDAALCCFDGINYLADTGEVYSCFCSAYENLRGGGLFIFDISTPYKYENILANNSFVYEYEDLFTVWESFYNKKSGVCDFDLTFFVKHKNGLWERSDEYQCQRKYSERTIISLLKKAGFELLETASDIDFSPVTATSEREFFICKKKV